jgi:hypothetical protein
MATTGTKSSQDAKNGEVYFADIYAKLAAPFDNTFKDRRGGIELEYITGEQVISRLNETLGVAGWNFVVKTHDYNQEADEYTVLGELSANFGGTTVVRQQFGSQKVKRSRSNGFALDIGFDLKGAATDSLKKCASLIGIGLYLSKKEEQVRPQDSQEDKQPPMQPKPAQQAQPQRDNGRAAERVDTVCAQCGEDLKEVKFRDGTVWTAQQLADYGVQNCGRSLCMNHYKQARTEQKQARA